MQYTKNWECIEKGSPGSAEADRGQPKKEHLQYIRKTEKCQGREVTQTLGKAAYWTGACGETRSGTVTGEYCPSLQLGVFFYRVKERGGKTTWVPGKDLKIRNDREHT